MCLLCVEIQKDRLTIREIAKNFREMTFEDQDHWVEVVAELQKKDLVEKVSEEISKIGRGE